MTTIVEKFDDKDAAKARMKELIKRGHAAFISNEPVPVKWQDVYEVRYHPENRSRKRAKAQAVAS